METKLGISNRGDLRQRIGYKDDGKLRGQKGQAEVTQIFVTTESSYESKVMGTKEKRKGLEEVRRGPHVHAGAQNSGRVWLAGAGTFKSEQRNWIGE